MNNVKKLCGLLLLFYLALGAEAQILDSTLIKQFRLNFAVPDMPAFKALGSDPSDILRPSDIKDIAVMVSDFSNKGQFTLPRTFAAEISPGLLIASSSVRLQEYQENALLRFALKTRLSIGSQRSDTGNNVYSAAAGIRLVLLDKGDFRNDKNFLKTHVIQNNSNINALITQAKSIYVSRCNIQGPPIIDLDNPDSCFKNILDSLKISSSIAAYKSSISSAMAQYKSVHWNAARIEMAYAALGNSPDSLGKDLKLEKHSVWAIGAFPLQSWGQVLIGATYNYVRNIPANNFYSAYSASSRLYIGSNRVKAFAEAQYKGDEKAKQESLLLNLGGEFNIRDGIWLHFSAGADNALGKTGKSAFVSSFRVHFTIPENFKLF